MPSKTYTTYFELEDLHGTQYEFQNNLGNKKNVMFLTALKLPNKIKPCWQYFCQLKSQSLQTDQLFSRLWLNLWRENTFIYQTLLSYLFDQQLHSHLLDLSEFWLRSTYSFWYFFFTFNSWSLIVSFLTKFFCLTFWRLEMSILLRPPYFVQISC